jgi:hypothetical protein
MAASTTKTSTSVKKTPEKAPATETPAPETGVSAAELDAAQKEIAALKGQLAEMSTANEPDPGPPTLSQMVAGCGTADESMALLAGHIETQTKRSDLMVALFKRLWGEGPLEDFGIF